MLPQQCVQYTHSHRLPRMQCPALSHCCTNRRAPSPGRYEETSGVGWGVCPCGLGSASCSIYLCLRRGFPVERRLLLGGRNCGAGLQLLQVGFDGRGHLLFLVGVLEAVLGEVGHLGGDGRVSNGPETLGYPATARATSFHGVEYRHSKERRVWVTFTFILCNVEILHSHSILSFSKCYATCPK